MKNERTVRKRCPQCGEVKAVRPKQETCSVTCSTARRKARGDYRHLGRLAAYRKPPMSLAGFGVLSEREAAIYQRGRANVLTYARDQRRVLEARIDALTRGGAA